MKYHPETDMYNALACEPSVTSEELADALRNRNGLSADFAALLRDPRQRAQYDAERSAYLARKQKKAAKSLAPSRGSGLLAAVVPVALVVCAFVLLLRAR